MTRGHFTALRRRLAFFIAPELADETAALKRNQEAAFKIGMELLPSLSSRTRCRVRQAIIFMIYNRLRSISSRLPDLDGAAR